MSSLPLVTVVTPSYNQGRFIQETIESVLLQDYPHIEYIVIDGGSTDNTLDILKNYKDRVVWISESDRGQAHAMNKGWSIAKGDILAWLNADDIYLPGAVQKAVDYLIQNPCVALVYGEGYHVAENGQIIERYPTEPFDVQRLRDTCYICQPTTFIRRIVIEEVGFLDESLNFCMDYDLWIRVSKKHSLGYLSEYLALSRLHAECKTLSQRVARSKEVLEMLYRHHQSVSPLKVGGYARAVLEDRLDRSVSWQNAAFILGLIVLCSLKFLRYNFAMPLSEFPRWGRGLCEGVKKLFKGERKFQ